MDNGVHEQTWPATATAQAHLIAHNWATFLIAGACVAAIVWGLILFSIIRWGRTPKSAPPQFKNNYPLEITWTIIPLVLVIALFWFSTYPVEGSVDTVAPHPAAVVDVTAYQWGWRFQYRNGPTIGGAQAAPANGNAQGQTPQLVVPLNETTQLNITSSDVNHSFWVPDFLYKRDAIAGQVSTFDITPNRLGTFAGHCAEFCGFNHTIMSFTVRVVTPAEFQQWERSTTQG